MFGLKVFAMSGLAILIGGLACINADASPLLIPQDEETPRISSRSAVAAPELDENLSPLLPYLGYWEVNSEWSSGDKLWARNEFSIGLGGKFVEARTYTKDEDGTAYCRYLTIYAWDKEQSKIVSHGFTYDGTTSLGLPLETSTSADGKPQLNSMWKPDPKSDAEIKQTITIIDDGSYSWKVWSRPDEDGKFEQIMDGVWKKKH
jgi:hypothetical protein